MQVQRQNGRKPVGPCLSRGKDLGVSCRCLALQQDGRGLVLLGCDLENSVQLWDLQKQKTCTYIYQTYLDPG